MVAVPEIPFSAPMATSAIGKPPVSLHQRRAVAVAVTAMELLRPESDLARRVVAFPHVDLLVVGDDPGSASVVETLDSYGEAYDDGHEVRADVERLGLPGLELHRLALRQPLGPAAEHDVVAAISELVGFDPEPSVYCLAPVSAPADAARAVVNRAARRIAQVYGIPLLRYLCLELSVVGEEGA